MIQSCAAPDARECRNGAVPNVVARRQVHRVHENHDDGGQTSTSIVVHQLDVNAERTGPPQSGSVRFWLRDSVTGDGGVSIARRGDAIYRDNPDGTSQVLVNMNVDAQDVALSPDGKMLYALIITRNPVFVSSIVVVFDVASGQRKDAFALPAGNAGANDIVDRGHYLSVSPDGTRLAIARWSGERQRI